MKKASIIGHFAFGKEYLDGQTVKTKIVSRELERRFGKQNVLNVDTHGGKKKLFLLPFEVFSALKKSESVIILPAHNGLRVIAPLLMLGNKLFHRKLHYVVIGGWLSEFLWNKPILTKVLKQFNYIYVETNTMMRALVSQGFINVQIMPNCKELGILDKSQIIYPVDEPYKLCTFSRVMKEKGIQDAINAVRFVNEQCGRLVYTLDIYGQIDSDQVDWFEEMKSTFPDYIKYSGLVPYDKSVEVLKNYFMLLFPTRFYTEGIPGTIIDAYAAGVPVISSKWQSFADMVDDGFTGIGYDFADEKSLKTILASIVDNPDIINNMRIACTDKAKEFIPKEAMKKLVWQL